MFNDDSWATAFVEEMGTTVRYVKEWNRWAVKKGTIWEKEQDDYVMDMFSDVVSKWQKTWSMQFPLGPDPFKRLLNYNGLLSAFKRMKAKRVICSSPEEFDTDFYAVNTPEGAISLTDGEVQCDKFLHTTTHLQGDGSLEYWPQVIGRITNESPELARYLQKAAGYTLSGSNREQCFFILYGEGRNGKSTFLNILKHILNTYAHQATSDLLSIQPTGVIRTDLAEIKGKRLVIVSELEKKKRLNVSLIKQITGGDSITARYLYQDHFTFTPQCKLWITTNQKPNMNDVGEALWRRLRLIPFTFTIPKEQTDTHIEYKLQRESRGIFNWMVEGFHLWQKEGLEDAECISSAIQEYKDESDTVRLFITEMLTPDPTARMKTYDLYNAYQQWCQTTRNDPLEYLSFGKALTVAGIEAKRTSQCVFRLGYRLA